MRKIGLDEPTKDRVEILMKIFGQNHPESRELASNFLLELTKNRIGVSTEEIEHAAKRNKAGPIFNRSVFKLSKE